MQNYDKLIKDRRLNSKIDRLVGRTFPNIDIFKSIDLKGDFLCRC